MTISTYLYLYILSNLKNLVTLSNIDYFFTHILKARKCNNRYTTVEPIYIHLYDNHSSQANNLKYFHCERFTVKFMF